jgi:uncharacterized protein YkwD
MRSISSRATNLRAINIQPQLENRYRGTVGETSPRRSYRLRLTQRSSLNLSLSNLKADADLSLVNRRGQVIGKSAHNGSSQESIAQTLEPGTYYVRVDRQQGKTRYRLKVGVSAQAGLPLTEIQSSSAGGFAKQLLALVNQQRRGAGLKPVKLNPLLTASAQAHSQDMALNDFFSHRGSNGSTAESRIAATGYNAFTSSENIAAGFATPTGVMQAWMDSPPHRKNLLNPILQEMGVGFFLLDNDLGNTNLRYYWKQDFGKPMF